MPEAFKARHHWVPQFYLKSFSGDGSKLYEYPLLVPHAEVPLWRTVAVKIATRRLHLYTETTDDSFSDEKERWFDESFEAPAKIPIQKAISGERLTPNDWRALVSFVALQDVRTPAFYLRSQKFWTEQLPAMAADMQKTLQDAFSSGSVPSEVLKMVEDSYSSVGVASSFTPDERTDAPELARFKLRTWVCRRTWLSDIENALSGEPMKGLLEAKWTVLRTDRENLVTSDTPVVKMLANGSDFSLGGGWTRPGTHIFLPISPYKVLYTEVGARPPERGTALTADAVNLLNDAMTENAFRSIFAVKPHARVGLRRKREENQAAWEQDQAQWANWPISQARAERREARK